MKFIVPDFWKQSGGYISFTLPESGLENLVRTAGKRTLPYWFFPKSFIITEFKVELPGNWQQCELSAGNYCFIIPDGPGSVEQQVMFRPGMLEVTNSADLWHTVFVQEYAYGVLEEMQKQLSNPANRTFLFKTIGK